MSDNGEDVFKDVEDFNLPPPPKPVWVQELEAARAEIARLRETVTYQIQRKEEERNAHEQETARLRRQITTLRDQLVAFQDPASALARLNQHRLGDPRYHVCSNEELTSELQRFRILDEAWLRDHDDLRPYDGWW